MNPPSALFTIYYILNVLSTRNTLYLHQAFNMVALQLFYEGRAGERLITKPAKSLSKVWTSIKSTKNSFAFNKVNRVPVPTYNVSVSTPAASGGHAAAIVAWPSSASIMISATGILPPVLTGMDSAVGETEGLEGLGDAYHDPDVLDIRRRLFVLDFIEAFFARDHKAMDILSPIHAPHRKAHAAVPSHQRISGTTVLNASTGSANEVLPRSNFKNETSLSDFIVRAKLGAGANGVVYRVEDKITNKTMALKVIKRQGAGLCDLQQFRVELDALKRVIGDRHCMQVEAGFQDAQCLYLALAFYPGGDLHDVIRTYPRRILPVDRARLYTAELLVGVYHLHCQGIIHRDLKPSNILIDSDGHLVIADLGLAKVFTLDDPKSFSPYNPTGTFTSLSQAPYLASSLCGTAEYMAPELIMGVKYGFAIDFWAVGVMLYEMLSGRTPWATVDGLHIADGIVEFDPYFDSNFHPEARDLLRGMLQKDVKSRPLYEAMLNHPLFASSDWKKVEKRTLPPLCIPMFDQKDTTTTTVPISLGQCEPSNDPLPNFNFISPALKRERHRAQALWRVKAKSGIQGLQKIAAKLFSRRPAPEKKEQQAARPACATTVTTLVDGDEIRANWASGAAEISCPSSNWSFRHFMRRNAPLDQGVPQPQPCDNYSGPVPVRRLESFISRIDRGERPRPGRRNLRVTPLPSRATASPNATLVASPTHLSPKGIASPSRTSGFKRWISRLWHPIPSAHEMVGDERKTLDLTA
ncbi:kinase-like domain-containing protein [Suillus clintonianus]|uniref:kinase-like domain-containing protein n=1 Tax=Suillus clintonianus TaxID=1904413 RepID=UPI001B882487|nr:kinase-like domain-containing protein [Suillus clintonianus]KAG2134098.1 kinase-like domain-containing protein [Suillus clintonianus]